MYICKHCGNVANDNSHFFTSHDGHPYCCISDRRDEYRLIRGTPYFLRQQAKPGLNDVNKRNPEN